MADDLTTLLLVDASMTTYRALFAHPSLSHQGAYTGALYGLSLIHI